MSQHSNKRNRRSRNIKGRGRGRVVGLAGVAGAALAFGMNPLAAAPRASADGLDAIIDSIAGSLAGLFDPGAGLVDASLGTELSTVGWSSADLNVSFETVGCSGIVS